MKLLHLSQSLDEVFAVRRVDTSTGTCPEIENPEVRHLVQTAVDLGHQHLGGEVQSQNFPLGQSCHLNISYNEKQ